MWGARKAQNYKEARGRETHHEKSSVPEIAKLSLFQFCMQLPFLSGTVLLCALACSSSSSSSNTCTRTQTRRSRAVIRR
eukprot:3525349-Rhodomonas_salina.2